MRILATNQFFMNFKESSSDTGLYGAWVATSDFYKNLIRFGKFDEYYFFVQPENNKGEKYFFDHKKFLAGTFDNRVKIRKIDQLASFLKETKDFVFFVSTPAIFSIAHLRSVYAERYFPICGLTHTVSYGKLLGGLFFQNMISDLQPFDSIVCTSGPVLESIKKMHRLIKKDAFAKMYVKISFKARLDCLPLGINTEDYMLYSKDESRKRLNLSAQKTIILYFGRLSIYNKADLYPLLFAFKHLLSKNKDILLVFAGKNFEGNYGGKLKKIVYDLGIFNNVKFFFNSSIKEKYLLYAASDIFVSPSDSLQESFGLSVLEAMASGLAVVVSDWDGYKDIVTHSKTGFLIPTYWTRCDQAIANSAYLFRNDNYTEHLFLAQSVCIDVKRTIEYLALLIKRRDLRLKFGYNARERVLRNYDWSVVIPKYEMLMASLIDEAKSCKAGPKGTPIFYPRYFECFKHYPSRILNKQTFIAITEEGERLLKTKKFATGIPLLNIINPQMVLLILFYLRERQSVSIGRIKEHVNKLFKEISPDKIDYHIMWMLKHYLIEVALK